MIIYNKTWLDNLQIRKASGEWINNGLISENEYKGIVAKYITGYKEQGFWARIGLFIFAIIIVLSTLGIISLLFRPDREGEFAIESFVLGAACYSMAERFVRNNNYLHSGIVYALLYSALFGLSFALITSINAADGDRTFGPSFYLTAITPLILIAVVRFADALLALVVYGFIVVINVLLVLKLGTFGKMILPFECMALSFAVYSVVKKQKQNGNLRYWYNCLWAIEVAAIIILYMAGNYMVIRSMTENMLNIEIQQGSDISLAFFFYAYTIAVPLVYVLIGLRNKDRIFVRLGALLVAAGVLSIKYYHSFMPVETALVLGGILVIAIAWLSIRYLKVPRNGITSNADNSTKKLDVISTIAFNELVAQNQPAPATKDVDFGGGSFGGGGAESKF